MNETNAALAPRQILSRHGIGGSEAAAALGLHPYQSPIELYQRKRAELLGKPLPDIDENDAIRWGNYLEQPIRQAYCDRFGVVVQTPRRSMFHREHAWRRATPDGLVLADDSDEIERGVEIKSASWRLAHRWGDDGTDDVPEHYSVQCAWSMHVLDVGRWDLAVLIGGSDFRCYRIDRDLELESSIVDRVARFWYGVEHAEPPEVDGTEGFREYLVTRWPDVQTAPVVADANANGVIRHIKAHRRIVADAGAELKRLENELRMIIGDAPGIESDHGRIACKPRAGRRITEWEAIARHLALELGVPVGDMAALIENHTKLSRPSRPLVYPRTWGEGAYE